MPITTIRPLIEVRDVAVLYKIRHGILSTKKYLALEKISLDILEGETLGIIGRNGAGKSTVLRLLAGIILPDRGRIDYQRYLTISLLTLQLGFSQTLSGRDNAILGAMLLGLSKNEAEARVESIAAFSELESWIDEPLHTYSSGMRARLGFAVAMEASPDVLLVDEILGVGDQMFQKKSATALKTKMRAGQTTVFVSHQLAMVSDLCDRTVWIEDGVTRMIGETKFVLSEYDRWSRTKIGMSVPDKRK